MQKFVELMREWIGDIPEHMPWDLEERMQQNSDILLVDVREQSEYDVMRIPGSICAPRGILESCCEWDFEETIPELVQARQREVVVVCRSGHRSLLSAKSLEILGFSNVASLKGGLKGWNDFDMPLLDAEDNPVDADEADEGFFTAKVRQDQLDPARRG
ncbi:MAG: rhodanese-like domain-containing protein [Pseudomonadota bacterium]